jgi:outer membrane lipoprotein-sorting protein
MSYLHKAFLLIGTFGLCATLSAVDLSSSEGNSLQLPQGKTELALNQLAIPELGEGRLSKILTRFYTESFGGPEGWDAVSSLKVTGRLKLKDGDYELNAYQKKPNLIKMTIRNNQRKLVLCYDGENAWQDKPGHDTSAEPMPPEEARRFIHNAQFGNYLLYPFAEGKTIEYIDTVPVEGSICHQIRVTLKETHFQVDYYIDIRSYLERKAVSTDLLSQKKNSVIYKNYERDSGMPIAMHIDSYEEGEWTSTLSIDEVKVNAGIVPWIFKMRP